jgi:hypothetical protein
MALAVTVDKSLEKIRDAAEQAADTVVDDVLDQELGSALERTLDEIEGKDLSREQVVSLFKARIKRPLKGGLMRAFGELLWSSIQAVLEADRLRVGVGLVMATMQELLSRNPERLRARIERAQERGDEQTVRELQQVLTRVEARRGNG